MHSLALKASIIALAAGHCAALYPANQNIPPDLDLDTLTNNSLYLRWRPQYHVLPPGGWMNDPCGPMYDSQTGLYHIFYQAHPQHVMAGNIGWSHATSKDLVTWTDIIDWRDSKMLAVKPSPYPSNDWLGVFSGGAQPVGLDGKQNGNLTMMYTGDNKLPDFWASPYASFTEGQFIATSSDGGVTWQKYPGNPILGKTPPGNWNITGWRDPLFYPDPQLDVILGQKEPHYYMTFGTGIRGSEPNVLNTPGAGPRIAVYSAKATDLTNWTFLGALFEVPQNYSFGGDATKTGNFAYNFEMSAVFSAIEEQANGGDGDTRHWIATFGAEGNPDRVHPIPHWSLYALGNVEKRQTNGSINMNIRAAGMLDWGNSYALNQFYDSKHDRRIVWGWSPEDMNNTGVKAQGFQGSLGLPREIYVLKTRNVAAPAGGVGEGPDIWTQGRNSNQFTVTTVAQRPAPDVVRALQQSSSPTKLGSFNLTSAERTLPSIRSDRYHLQLSITNWVREGNGSVGVKLRMSPGREEYTTLTYFARNHSVVLDRSHSSLIPAFIKDTYVGYHEPYTYTDGSAPQPLNIDLWLDGSLLEIFINNRFAMTGRVYPSRADALLASVFSNGGAATFNNVTVWDRFANVWPQRPLNASSPLLFDPYNMTHVTFNTSRVPYVPYEVYPGY